MQSASAVQAKFSPRAHDNYVQAFQRSDELLAEHGVTTPVRLAHFLAQVMHETGGLVILVESGKYSARALGKQWDAGNWRGYFADRATCLGMADHCSRDWGETLFNLVYSNRMGNGPPASGDGWRYRGRGLMQTTGRYSYARFGKRCGVTFEDEPDLVFAPEHALKPALAEWKDGNLNAAADANDIKSITKRINGGHNGLEDRKEWFAKIYPFISHGHAAVRSVEWKVQEALTRAGFDTMGVDGIIGRDTRAAIILYRKAQGLPGPAAITPDLLEALEIAMA